MMTVIHCSILAGLLALTVLAAPQAQAVPILSVDRAEYDFGTFGSADFDYYFDLYLTNSGTTTATILDVDLTTNVPFAFSTFSEPTTVPAGTTATMRVHFAVMLAAGDYNGTLTITSDDPVNPTHVLTLAGRVVDTPPILVRVGSEPFEEGTPVALVPNLASTKSVVLTNFSNTPAAWESHPLTADASWIRELNNLIRNEISLELQALIPSPAELDASATGSGYALFNPSLFDDTEGGNQLMVRGVPRPYSDRQLGEDGTFITVKIPQLFVVATRVGSHGSIGTHGSLVDLPGREISSTSFAFTALGEAYTCHAKFVYGGGTDVLNHLWITKNDPGIAHLPGTDPTSDLDRITGLPFGSRADLLVCATAGASPRPMAEFEPLLRTYIEHTSPPKVTFAPASGVIPPGEAVTIDATFQSANLAPLDPYIYTLELPLFVTGNRRPIGTIAGLEVFPNLGSELVFDPSQLDLLIVDDVPVNLPQVTPSLQIPNVLFDWTASTDAPWLSVSPTSGSDGFAALLPAVDLSILPPGVSSANILVTVEGSEPVLLPVQIQQFPLQLTKLIAEPGIEDVYGMHTTPSPDGALQPYIARIDSQSGAVINLIEVPRVDDIALDTTGERILYSDWAALDMFAISIADWPQEQLLTIPAYGNLLAAAPGFVWTTTLDHGAISSWNLNSGSATDSASVDNSFTTHGLAAIPDRAELLIAGGLDGSGGMLAIHHPLDGILNRTEIASAPPEHTLPVASRGGERFFWGRQVYNTNLFEIGSLPETVIDCSHQGELALSTSNVRRLSTGGDVILTLPFTATTAVIWGEAERVIAHNADTGQTVSLTLRDYSLSDADFGDVPLGSSASTTVTVSNHGVEALTLTDFIAEDIDLSPLPLVVAPGGSADLTATFTPGSESAVADEVILLDSFIDSPTRSFSFTATGTFDPASLPGYATWQAAQWPGGSAQSGPLDDPDSDGSQNFVEFLFGLDPMSAGDPQQHLPAVSAGANGEILLSFVRATDAAAHIAIERSTDLVSWRPAVAGFDFANETVSALGNGTERVALQLPNNTPGSVSFRARAQLLVTAP